MAMPTAQAVGGGRLIFQQSFGAELYFLGNMAENGAGIYTLGNTNITNCSFWGNKASLGGGGIYCSTGFLGATITVTNCSFSRNAAPTFKGGAIYRGPSSTVNISNCILYGDEGGEIFYDQSSGNISVAHSIVLGACEFSFATCLVSPLFVNILR